MAIFHPGGGEVSVRRRTLKPPPGKRRPHAGTGGRRPAARSVPRRGATTAREGRKPTRNLRLLIEYEGTRYAGWQVQPKGRTVAGEILAAIRSELGDQPRLFGAGRTDHGVHAEGQVANFHTASTLAPATLADALNRVLPADIHILRIEEVPASFHARHDALSRRYRYQLASRRSAFFKKLVWWVRRPLDRAAMTAAVSSLPGRHDFLSFADRAEEVREPRVRVQHAAIGRSGMLTTFTIEADHFLPKMVRRLVGVLVQIGIGELPVEAMRRFLEHRVDDPAAWTAPPSGLFLERIGYPPGADPAGRGGRRSGARGARSAAE